MSNHEKIKEILLNHKGKINMITAPAIAEQIGIDPGPSGVDIRNLITETIITYHLPIASSNRGYYLLEGSDGISYIGQVLRSRLRSRRMPRKSSELLTHCYGAL